MSPRLPGVDDACRTLADGQAVVLPNASPLSYAIVATTPRPVNGLKGRPLDQNVGITLYDETDWERLLPAIDLPGNALARVRRLMRRELLSFLIPLRDDVPCPEWIAPAVRNGHLGMFAGRWAPLAAVWERFPRLFGSSANRTGHPPACTAAEAAGVFGDEAVVVDGDALRDPGRPHGATTILRVAPDGKLSVHRSGAHDAGLAPEAFLARLDGEVSSRQ